MGLGEADGEEEGLFRVWPVGLEALDGFGGDAAVGVGAVVDVGRFPGGAAGEAAGRAGC